jgi:hypothetical protein
LRLVGNPQGVKFSGDWYQTAVNNRLAFVNGVFWALAPAPMGAICLNGTGNEKQRQTLLAR